MEASKKNITEIFNRASRLQVPYFQRSYVWEEPQWNRLLEDMQFATKTNRHYFMGAVILKQQEMQIGDGAAYSVIDGQQRLTTLMLFFKALYENNGDDVMFSNIFTTFSGKLLMEHNHFDRPVFEKVLYGKLNEITEEEKESNIYRCYNFYKKEIQPNTIDPNQLFSNIMFVGISLQQGEDEQQIFDTINSLGVRLTTAELLKNYLFNRDYKAYEQYWLNTFEADQDLRDYWDMDVTSGRIVRNNIDLFLQAYLFIKIQDPELGVSSDDRERYYKLESIFSSYKEFIEQYFNDKAALIVELKEFAAIYKNTIKPLVTEQYLEPGDRIARLNTIIFGLEVTTIIPYVLYVAREQTNVDEQNRLFAYLETYLMRRLVTRGTTKNYNNLFRSLIGNQVITEDGLKEFIAARQDASVRMPDDEKVSKAFVTEALTNKQAKGVLFLIESAVRNSRHATRLLNFDGYSLEHVMPKKWRNNWKTENLSEQAAYERDDLLLTLGNLTLITSALNSAISDSDWDKKRQGKTGAHGLNMFAQGIETFSLYLGRDEWNEEVINERAQELTNHALSIWSVPQELQQRRPVASVGNIQVYCTGSGANTEGVFDGVSLTVLKGSRAAFESKPSFSEHSYNSLRQELIAKNVLEENDGYYVFTSDYTFSSPSAAAAVVMGRSADGPSEWKNEEGNKLSLLLDGSEDESKVTLSTDMYHDFFTKVKNLMESEHKESLGDLQIDEHKAKNYMQMKYQGFGNNHFELRFLRRSPVGPAFEIALHRECKKIDLILRDVFESQLPKLSEILGENVAYERWGKEWERVYYLYPTTNELFDDETANKIVKRVIDFIHSIQPYVEKIT
ncbi:DUF4357 domain-containing protein [Patescibacteria group bacterium]|nr:DUF4357 domain-containing protein [Patescibacteria group bacterium]